MVKKFNLMIITLSFIFCLTLVSFLIPVQGLLSSPSEPKASRESGNDGLYRKTGEVSASAGDWPMYLHDVYHTSFHPNETLLTPTIAPALTKLWSFETGDNVGATPAVVNNIVYVGSGDGYEYALDAGTGALKWKTYLGQSTVPAGCGGGKAGIDSSSAVVNGSLYVGGGDGNFYALDTKSGRILWKIFLGDPAAGNYLWSSPVVYNSNVYEGIASFGDCPQVQGKVVKMSLLSHKIVGTFNVVPNGQRGGPVWSSPLVDPASNTLYVTTGDDGGPNQPYAQAFLALDATSMTLKQSWQIPSIYAHLDDDFGTSPIFFQTAKGTFLAATNKNGFLYVMNATNLSAGPVWTQQVSTTSGGDNLLVSPGTFMNGILYFASTTTTIKGKSYPGSVRAFDPNSGKILWQHGTQGIVFGALASANGILIVNGGSIMEVLNAATGDLLYSFNTTTTIWGGATVSNGKIFVGSTNGYVYAFSAHPHI